MKEMEGTKEKAIELMSRHHSEFIDMAKSIAGNNRDVINYAEDFVQDAYIRLLRYDDLYDKVITKKGTVSKGYMFFTLRSIIINAIKKKSDPKYQLEGDQFDFEEKYLSPVGVSKDSSDVFKRKHRNIGSNPNRDYLDNILEDEAWASSENGTLDRLEEKMLQVVKDNSDWWDYELFKTYVKTGKSYKTIASESGIGLRTIYLSIKKSKLIIAEHLYEDYQDLKNGDWDLI